MLTFMLFIVDCGSLFLSESYVNVTIHVLCSQHSDCEMHQKTLYSEIAWMKDAIKKVCH
jgi:hypothetical protein